MARHPYTKDDSQVAQLPTIRLAQKNPVLAAAVAKTVSGRIQSTHDSRGNRRPNPTGLLMRQSSLARAQRNADAKTTLAILPDLAMSAQILVSSILSPKDMTSFELIYQAPEGLVAPELASEMVEALRELLEKKYNLRQMVPESLNDALFEKGSYPTLVLPENTVDEMINRRRRVGLEELGNYINLNTAEVKPLGFLGNPDEDDKGSTKNFKAALESLAPTATATYNPEQILHFGKNSVRNPNVKIIDNPVALRIGALMQVIRESATHKTYAQAGFKTALESHVGSLTDYQIDRAIMRPQRTGSEVTETVPSQFELRRKSVGDPLIIKLPTESVIPIHVPGDPKTHIGYIVAIDEEGNPLRHTGKALQFGTLNSTSQNTVGSALTQHVGTNLLAGGTFDQSNHLHVQMAQQAYADAVERDLIARVRNSGMIANAAISPNVEVYRLMLARTLANQTTQMLYVPKEYLSYIALMYGDDGVGESLLDRQSQLSAMRAVLLMADIVNSVRNAVGRTKVTMTIDEDDADPENTILTSMEEIVRTRSVNIPTGINDPTDIMRYIQNAGYEWEILNNPNLPETKFEFSQTNTSYPKVDTDLQEQLRAASIKSFGLSPEMVDNSFNPEFATTVTQNNVLLAKRVIVLQDLYTPQLTDLFRKLASFNADIVDEIKAILEKNFDKIIPKATDLLHSTDTADRLDPETEKKLIVSYVLQAFFSGFNVSLPRPSSVTVSSQKDDLEAYSSLLDTALDAYFDSDMLNSATVGDLEQNVGTLKASYKAHFLRQWMADHGVLPELASIMQTPENIDDGVAVAIAKHIMDLTQSAVKTLAKLTQNAKAANNDLAKNDVAEGAEGTPSSSGSSGDDVGGDDLGGFNLGDGLSDLPGGDEDTSVSEDSKGTGDEAEDTPKENEPSDDTPEDDQA